MGSKLTITPTEIPDVKAVDCPLFGDARGFFTELYNGPQAEALGLRETFVQDNLSMSGKGTLRGLHYQLDPCAQGKLVHVVHGRAFDVAVDIRRGSPSFGQWVARELSGESGLALWIPPGFAHGFLALEDETILFYKNTSPYAPETARTIHYACSEIGIDWPMTPTTVSEKDEAGPPLADAEYNFAYSAS